MHSLIWFWTTGIHDPAWVQAFAAIALVVLTLVTLIVLSIYAWDTHSLAKSSKLSADAAKISSDIAARISIPTLIVHEFGVGNVANAGAEAFFQLPKIKITIKNYGQTPALLKWWSICFTCEDLPDIPVYEGLPGSGIHLEKVVVQPGELYSLPEAEFFQRQQFSVEDVQAIIKREKIFHAYGYICYSDVFNHPLRRLKFCEAVLNIFDFNNGEDVCDWWEELALPAYRGEDQFPVHEHIGSQRE